MKKVTIVFVGHMLDPALLDFGQSVGAQYRNAHYVEGLEPCDYVAGYPIPDIYKDHPLHPVWKPIEESGDGSELPGLNFQGDAGQVLDALNAQGPLDDGTEEIELTAEYLEGLTKKQMIELADEEELDLTADQKKTAASLLEALKTIYEL